MKLFKPKSVTYAVYYNHQGKSYMQPYVDYNDAKQHFDTITDPEAVMYRITLHIENTKK